MKRRPTASGPLIDWPVRVRRCAHGQNEPRCFTRVNKCLLRPSGKKTEGETGAAPVLPAVAPLDWQDRSGWINSQNSHMIIRAAPCWILTPVWISGFFFQLMCLLVSFADHPAGTRTFCRCTFTLRHSTLNWHFVRRVKQKWSLRR